MSADQSRAPNLLFHSHLPPFHYFQPSSLAEVISLLNEHAGEARLLAGGTDLLVLMRERNCTPSHVINIKDISGLDRIDYDDRNGASIGALTTISDLEESEVIKTRYQLLHDAASQMATAQVKNMATIAGNICRASPAADTVPPLLVLEAEIEIAGEAKSRVVPLDDFFLGPGETVVRDYEIVTKIRLPVLPSGSGTAFLRVSRVAADLAKVNTAAVITIDDNLLCRHVRIALGGVAPTPIRAKAAEEVLMDSKLSSRLIDEAARAAAEETSPITDVRSSREYRKRVSEVLVRRSLKICLDRTQKNSEGLGNWI